MNLSMPILQKLADFGPQTDEWLAFLIPHAADVLILAFVVWLLDAMLRRPSAAWRHALWSVVLLRALAPVQISSPVSIVGAALAAIDRVWPVQEVAAPQYEPAAAVGGYSMTVNAAAVESIAPQTAVHIPLSTTVFLLWAAGSLTLLAICLQRTWRLAQMTRDRRPCADRMLIAAYEKLIGRMALRNQPELLLVPGLGSPMVYGLFRPKILLPESLVESMPIEQLEPILAHELAHIRRLDPVSIWLQILSRLLFFWHPGVWLADIRLRRYREEACDDIAVQMADGKQRAYADGLLRALELGLVSPLSALTLFGASEDRRELETRLRRILESRNRVTRLSLTGLAAVAAIVCLTLPGTSVSQPQDDAPSNEFLDTVIPGELSMDGAELSVILPIVQEASGISYVLDSGVNPKVTAALNSPTVREFLDAVMPACRLDYFIPAKDTIRIGVADVIREAKANPRARKSNLDDGVLQKRIEGDLAAEMTPVGSILDMVSEASNLSFVLDEGVNPGVTFMLHSPDVQTILDIVLPSCGLDYMQLGDGRVRIGPANRMRAAKSGAANDGSRLQGKTSDDIPGLDVRVEGDLTAQATELSSILLILQDASPLVFILDQGVNPKVTFNLRSPTVREVLDTVLPVYGLYYIHLGGGRFRIGPASDIQDDNLAALDARVEGDLIAQETELSSILLILHDASSLNFIIDHDMNPKVTFSLSSPTVREVLDTVLPAYGLKYIQLDNGIIRIGRASDIQDAYPPELDVRLDGDLIAQETKLASILLILQDASSLDFILDSGVNPNVTFTLRSPTVREVLDTVLPAHGLVYVYLGGGRIRIGLASDIQVTNLPELDTRVEGDLIAQSTELASILLILRDASSIDFILDNGVNPKVTFTLRSPSVREVLDTVLPAYGLDYIHMSANRIRIGLEDDIRSVKSNLTPGESPTAVPTSGVLQTRVTGDLIAQETELRHIFMILHDASGLEFIIDEGANVKVTFTLRSPTVQEVLDLVLPSNGLAYVYLGGGRVRIGAARTIQEGKKTVDVSQDDWTPPEDAGGSGGRSSRRRGARDTAIAPGMESSQADLELTTVKYDVQHEELEKLQGLIRMVCSRQARISFDIQNHAIVITDTPEAHEQIGRLLEVLDRTGEPAMATRCYPVNTTAENSYDAVMAAIEEVKSASASVFYDPKMEMILLIDREPVLSSLDEKLPHGTLFELQDGSRLYLRNQTQPGGGTDEDAEMPRLAPHYYVKLVFGEKALIVSYTLQEIVVETGDVVKDPLGDFRIVSIDAGSRMVQVELVSDPSRKRWLRPRPPERR